MADQPLKTEPTPPAKDAPGKLSEPAKRHLRKAFGAPATEVVEQIRQFAAETHTQQCVLAKEFLLTRDAVDSELKALHKRLDGQAQWCERTEAQAERLERSMLSEAATWYRLRHGGLGARLRWVLFGEVPPPKGAQAQS